jgi:hypothetical protein
MLDDGKAGRRFEDFSRFCHWARVEVRAGNDHLARHLRHDGRSAGHIGSASLVGRRWRWCGCRRGRCGCGRCCRGLWSGIAFRRRRRRLGGNGYSRKLCRIRGCGRRHRFWSANGWSLPGRGYAGGGFGRWRGLRSRQCWVRRRSFASRRFRRWCELIWRGRRRLRRSAHAQRRKDAQHHSTLTRRHSSPPESRGLPAKAL